MWKRIVNKWSQYRYRFVPWLAVNLKNRTTRSVPKGHPDKIIPDETVEQCLRRFFDALNRSSCDNDATGLQAHQRTTWTPSQALYEQNLEVMWSEFGFIVERRQSHLPGGGCGVLVTRGTVPQGKVVSLYPGTVYLPYEAIFLASIGNPFIFRCLDGLLIDGNDRNLSKVIYRSCCNRDKVGPFSLGDSSWLTQYPINPLAVGQYVNNQSKRFLANVAYQEFDIPDDFPVHLRRFIPNIRLTPDPHNTPQSTGRLTRVVALVSTRPIQEGEELYSSYFTIVH